MQRNSFQKALMATAHITCCASLFGLGCRTMNKNIDTSLSNNTDTSSDNLDSTAISSCEEIITEAFLENTFPDPATISTEVKDCCTLTAEYYDALALQDDGSYDWTVIDQWTHRDSCCSATGWSDGSMACTPWGPPTPPSITNIKQIKRIFALRTASHRGSHAELA